LGISRAQLVGHLHFLWYWAVDNAQPNGRLGPHVSPTILAEAAEFPVKKSELFVNSLKNCGGDRPGFLEEKDSVLYLHDWYDYAGKLNVKRAEDRDRKRLSRQEAIQRTSKGRPAERPTDVAGTVPTVPTVPTEKSIEKVETELPDGVDRKNWDDFVKMRKQAKAVLTSEAAKRIITELKKLKDQGNNPNEVLNQSIINNWKGVFPLKENKGGINKGHNQATPVRPVYTPSPEFRD
jgi:hypothetical protein